MKRGMAILGIAVLGALASASGAAAATPAGAQSAALPAVMRRINGQCAMALVFRNMQSFSIKINKLSRLVSPHASRETVQKLFKSMGSTRGINYGGSAAWVLSRLPKNAMMAMQAPSMAFIIPVRNAKAFLAPLHPQAVGRGIARVTLPNEDSPVYAASLGKFVVLSFAPNIGQFIHIKKSLAISMAAPLARQCAGQDVFFYVSPAKMEARTMAWLKLGYAEVQNMGNFNNAPAKKNAPKPKVHYSGPARWRLGMALAQSVMNSVPQMVIGMHIGTHGDLTLVQQAIVKKDSALGRILQRNGALPPKPLAGLPVTGNCLAAAAGAFDGSGVAQAVHAINQAMLRKYPKLAKSGFEMAELPGFLKDIALFNGQKLEFSVHPEIGIIVSQTPHPRQLSRAIARHEQKASYQFTLKPNAVTTGGYVFTLGTPQNRTPAARRHPSSPLYFGAGPHQAVTILTRKPARVANLINHLAAGGNALARRMQILAGKQKVLGHPGFLAFLALDRWGAAAGAAPPANALVTGVAPPPVVVSGAVEKNGLRIRIDVPRGQVHDMLKDLQANTPFIGF